MKGNTNFTKRHGNISAKSMAPVDTGLQALIGSPFVLLL